MWLLLKDPKCYLLSSLVAQMVESARNVGDRVRSLGWEDLLEKSWQPTPGLLPGKFYRRRGLVGCSPWGHRVGDD